MADDHRDGSTRKVVKAQSEALPAEGDRIITINVSGVKFQIRQSTLTSHPTSLLGAMLISPTADRGKSEFFFDANPRAFESVLDMYRRGIIRCPPDMDIEVFRAELDFWQIPSTDTVDSLMEVDARLLREATLKNTKHHELKLLPAADVEQTESSSRERPRRSKRRNTSTQEGDLQQAHDSVLSTGGVAGTLPSESSRMLNAIDSLAADAASHIAKLRGTQRILSSVRRALTSFSAGVYEFKEMGGLGPSGQGNWRLLQCAAECKEGAEALQDGFSLDEVLTSLKGNEDISDVENKDGDDRVQFGPEALGGEDRVLYDWWAKTVGAENLELFWMPFFVRPDRERVYVDFTFQYFLKTRKEFYELLQTPLTEFELAEEAAAEEEKRRARDQGAAVPSAGKKKLGRMEVQFETITRYGIHACWSVDVEDHQNGGYYALVRYDVPMLRVHWRAASSGPGPQFKLGLEERLLAVLEGKTDPCPEVEVLRSARVHIRNVVVENPRRRSEL